MLPTVGTAGSPALPTLQTSKQEEGNRRSFGSREDHGPSGSWVTSTEDGEHEKELWDVEEGGVEEDGRDGVEKEEKAHILQRGL